MHDIKFRALVALKAVEKSSTIAKSVTSEPDFGTVYYNVVVAMRVRESDLYSIQMEMITPKDPDIIGYGLPIPNIL